MCMDGPGRSHCKHGHTRGRETTGARQIWRSRGVLIHHLTLGSGCMTEYCRCSPLLRRPKRRRIHRTLASAASPRAFPHPRRRSPVLSSHIPTHYHRFRPPRSSHPPRPTCQSLLFSSRHPYPDWTVNLLESGVGSDFCCVYRSVAPCFRRPADPIDEPCARSLNEIDRGPSRDNILASCLSHTICSV